MSKCVEEECTGLRIKKPLLIILNGPPGAGKTVLAKKLSAELEWPVLARDEIKELLFDQLGTKDRDWSMKLGGVGYGVFFLMLEKMLRTNATFIIESNFDPVNYHAQIKELLNKQGYPAIELFFSATPDVLLGRFKKRWESDDRHRGHVDHERFLDLESRLADI